MLSLGRKAGILLDEANVVGKGVCHRAQVYFEIIFAVVFLSEAVDVAKRVEPVIIAPQGPR